MAMPPDDAFYNHVLGELVLGRVTPFLGAGVNFAGATGPFIPGQRLPSGAELAVGLADTYSYPYEMRDDLVRVSQWVSLRLGSDTLYDYLHRVFDHDYAPTAVHELLARMPRFVRERNGLEYPLILTTNYDDALERAFEAAGEDFELLTYLAQDNEDRGKFRHTSPTGKSHVIHRPDHYEAVSLAERPVIVQLHGAVKRGSRIADDDSYVVTEDDYIECLTRTDIVSFLPPSVVKRMQRCHYLFLGYSLRDWNLRAILHRIRRDRALGNQSWVLSIESDPLQEKAWNLRKVEMFDLDLTEFARSLEARMLPLKEPAEG